MEKPTVTSNNYGHPAEQSQHPEHAQESIPEDQQPPKYDNRDFSSPLAQPPLTNNHPPTNQQDGGFPPAQQTEPTEHAHPEPTKPECTGLMHAIAASVCFFTCLGCIPYCIESLKDVHHQCGNCNIPLASYHRSGVTEVRYFQK
ncbi:hypothetical protein NXS19_004331 [Fusarium pseudograminearum]|nr:hypothetical protein NXS19_004331 [Fusarium pseudograminearum]